MPVAGTALIRRRLRQRFGIAAHRVSVRSEIAWYWRALLWVVVISTSIALAAWIYDSGMRFAGFHRSETDRELAGLKEQVVALESELAGLRLVANSSDSRLKVEATTQDSLAIQIKGLQRENASLKQDLALFEGLVAGGAQNNGLRIARVLLEPAGINERWRYRVLVVNSGAGRNAKELGIELQFELTVRQGAKDVSITIPANGSDPSAFRFSIKHFQRLEGDLILPAGGVLKAGEVRLFHDGVLAARQSVSLPTS